MPVAGRVHDHLSEGISSLMIDVAIPQGEEIADLAIRRWHDQHIRMVIGGGAVEILADGVVNRVNDMVDGRQPWRGTEFS